MFIILPTVPGSIEFVASSSGEIDENELCTLCIYYISKTKRLKTSGRSSFTV